MKFCNLFAKSESPKYLNSKFLTLIEWICNSKSQNMLYRIIYKNHNKRFGEFEYFGGSDVANKLLQKWARDYTPGIDDWVHAYFLLSIFK
mgnify:CR=1 FL=1